AVIEVAENALALGKAGLAQFRETQAEFKQFQVGKQIAPRKIAPAILARIEKSVANLPVQGDLKPETVDALVPDASPSLKVLRDRARMLELQAAQIRKLAQAVHHKGVQQELVKALEGKEEDVDLMFAALLIARLDNDELDVAAYRKEVDRL